MAKKGFGKVVALATVAGAAAAGISYFKKYKSFNEELEEDFHDFEGDEEDFFDEEEDLEDYKLDEEGLSFVDDDEDVISFSSTDQGGSTEDATAPKDARASRKYISLNANTDELKLAAKGLLFAAGDVADAAKNVLKDAAGIIADTAMEAASAAKDTAQAARVKASERMESRKAASAKTSEEGSASSEASTSEGMDDITVEVQEDVEVSQASESSPSEESSVKPAPIPNEPKETPKPQSENGSTTVVEELD